jgi:hypothetical protein
LAIETDGRLHETDANLFESDRWRQNALVADDGAFCVSLGRCCAIILTPSFKRFLTRCTENASRLCGKSMISPRGCS